MIWPRFPDPLMEQRYVYKARAAQGRYTGFLLQLAGILIGLYIVVNPRILTIPGMNSFNDASLTVIALLAIYYVVLRTEFYKKNPIADLVIFIPISLVMAWIAHILAGEASTTGWSPVAVSTGNAEILLPFAVICFVASPQWFACWCVFELATYFCNTVLLMHSSDGLVLGGLGLSAPFAVGLYTNYLLDKRARAAFGSMADLTAEKRRTEGLLYNVLPQFAAEKLRQGLTVAEAFSEATVVFIDLVDSTVLAKKLSPTHFVGLLNRLFLLADKCATKSGIEKVKTVGDAYVAIAGTHGVGGASDAISFAKEVIAGVRSLAGEMELGIHVRIGVHSGPVIGGVIGEMRMAYDYWGDTMNVASRIQSIAALDGVAVSVQAYNLTKQQHQFAHPRAVVLKGIGDLEVYDVELDRAGVPAK